MNHHELNVIDFHTHFPVANVAGPKRKATHPLLAEYARSRGERMRKEHATLPAEPSAKTDEEIDSIAREFDCDSIEIRGRKGWERIANMHGPEYKTAYIVIRKDLNA